MYFIRKDKNFAKTKGPVWIFITYNNYFKKKKGEE